MARTPPKRDSAGDVPGTIAARPKPKSRRKEVKPSTPEQAIVAAVEQAIATTPEAEQATNLILKLAMKEIANILRHGQPDQKMVVVRSLLPAVARTFTADAGEDTERQELRSKLEALYAEVLGVDEPVVLDDDGDDDDDEE